MAITLGEKKDRTFNLVNRRHYFIVKKFRTKIQSLLISLITVKINERLVVACRISHCTWLTSDFKILKMTIQTKSWYTESSHFNWNWWLMFGVMCMKYVNRCRLKQLQLSELYNLQRPKIWRELNWEVILKIVLLLLKRIVPMLPGLSKL